MEQNPDSSKKVLIPEHVHQMDEYVKKALIMVDTQLHNELREFYKPIRRFIMELSIPKEKIVYREKIVEIESISQKREIERLKKEIKKLKGEYTNGWQNTTEKENVRAQSILRAILKQPDLF